MQNKIDAIDAPAPQNAGGILLIPLLPYSYVVVFPSMRKTQKHGYKTKKV